MRLLISLALGGIILAGNALAEGAGDRGAGKLLAGQCRTCHGLDGNARIPIAPHIGGENADYIANQLTAFRDGTREHEMMTIVAKSLTDEQILDLAAWYSGHSISATLSADASAAPETCVACHGADGIALIPDAPNLAGESNIYIDTQLKAFRIGKRKHEVMTEIAKPLSDADIRSMADWYAQVTIDITTVE
jgi:cytochrome c553